jgi:hypothetical protein
VKLRQAKKIRKRSQQLLDAATVIKPDGTREIKAVEKVLGRVYSAATRDRAHRRYERSL